MIPLVLLTLLATAPADAADDLVRGPHLPSPAAIAAARAPDVQAELARIALDPKAPLSSRIRAVHLISLGPKLRAAEVWRALFTHDRDPRVRAEAAWARGLAAKRADPTLLDDAVPEVRVVGLRLLARDPNGLAAVRAHVDASALVRAARARLIRRR